MVKYAGKVKGSEAKSVKARASDLRTSYKRMREVAGAIRHMRLKRAQTYLKNVLAHKEIIPYRRFVGGIGRHAQAKQFKATQGRWPKKSVEAMINLLNNAESNAVVKQLSPEALVVSHVQVNQAVKGRRRTYRAHGRINPFMSHPCHVEMILEEDTVAVEKAAAGDVKGATKSVGGANKAALPASK